MNLFAKSIRCLLHLYSRVDNMTGFYLPGDSYFPNHGNDGCIEPEDDHVVPIEEDFPKDSDLESEFYDPPQIS